MKNALQARGASSKKFLAGTPEEYAQKSEASRSKSSLHQDQLFIELEDRPERELGWICNPSAPATEGELKEFFRGMAAMLTDSEGGNEP
jgi:hypothetical protein